MKFNFKDYTGNYVMHCQTEEECIEFCKLMHDDGRCWVGGLPYSKTNNFDVYRSGTVYYFNEGYFGSVSGLCRSSYTILKWSDFFKSKYNVELL